MHISPFNTYKPHFGDLSYKAYPLGVSCGLMHVNVPVSDGENPVIIYSDEKEREMRLNGQYYIGNISSDNCTPFKIRYQDGREIGPYNPDVPVYMNRASVAIRGQYGLPLVATIRDGKTIGKIKFMNIKGWDQKAVESITEPTILVSKEACFDITNPNVVGLLVISESTDCFAHYGMLFPYETDLCAAVFDPKTIKELKKCDGKNVEMEIKNNKISFHKTTKPAKARTLEHVDVPELEYCDRVLTSKECTPNLVGMKAVNLRKLEEMSEEGKIDAIVPKFMVLPPGYLKDFEYDAYHKNGFDLNSIFELREKYVEGGIFDELIQTLKDNGIDGDMIAMRPAFNVQDIPGCDSGNAFISDKIGLDPNSIFLTLQDRIMMSTIRDPYMQRLKYDIPKEKYQPCVILQKYVDCDYQLIIKTDYDDDKVKIDLYTGYYGQGSRLSNSLFRWENGNCHTFIYDKKTGELTRDHLKLDDNPYVVYDQDGNEIEKSPVIDEISGNKKLISQLRKVVKDALKVEKECGEPQCIDAGLKDDDIYFFQTRDIVR